MGLAGPRNKQRISADPQNKAWANDTGKFGYQLMQKMGWADGKGLGADESGVTTHVKTIKKSDNAGIGSTTNTSDNWLRNTDAFSRLLAELNERMEESSESKLECDEEQTTEESNAQSKKKSKKERKEEQRKKTEQVKLTSDSMDSCKQPTVEREQSGRYAARAKYLKNKKMATSSTENLEDIIGLKKAERVMNERSLAAAAVTSNEAEAETEFNDESPTMGLGFSSSTSGKSGLAWSTGSFIKATVPTSSEESTSTTQTVIKPQDNSMAVDVNLTNVKDKSNKSKKRKSREVDEIKELNIKKNQKSKA